MYQQIILKFCCIEILNNASKSQVILEDSIAGKHVDITDKKEIAMIDLFAKTWSRYNTSEKEN